MGGENYCVNGCLEMFGAHIRLCLEHVHRLQKKEKYEKKIEQLRTRNKAAKKATKEKRKTSNEITVLERELNEAEQAWHYIMNGGLEFHVATMGIPLEVGFIQQQAKKIIKGDENDTGNFFTSKQRPDLRARKFDEGDDQEISLSESDRPRIDNGITYCKNI